MDDQEKTEAATATEIGGITFLSPPTAVPCSRRHLLLDEAAVRRPLDHDGDKAQDGQDLKDAEKPAAVAATQKERSPLTLKGLLANQTRQDREMAASERKGAWAHGPSRPGRTVKHPCAI